MGDVETAARVFGPPASAGSLLVQVGMVVAVAGALLSEAQIDGLRSSAWATRAASFMAILAVVGIAVAPGPGRTSLEQSLVWWAASGVVIVLLLLALARTARRLPDWVPPVVAAAGIVAALMAS
jgi:hypothetical protein